MHTEHEHDRESFGRALRRLRGDASLRDLSRASGYSKTHLADLENGRRLPTAEASRRLDDALGARGELLALAETPGDTLETTLERWETVQRRNFLAGTGAAGAAIAAAHRLAAHPRPTPELLAAQLELRLALGRLENLRGAAVVYVQAEAHHRQLTAWHRGAATAAERRLIAPLAADAAGFLGWIAFDLGLYAEAADRYHHAASLAADAGDISSAANHIGQLSRTLGMCGHRRQALDFADAAVRIAGTAAHPAVRSWLHAVRAYHQANLDHPRSARRDLKAAWALLDRARDGEVPGYIGYLSSAELAKWSGHTLHRLAAADSALRPQAHEAIAQARREWPTGMVRARAEVLTAHARVLLAEGEVEEAARTAAEAADIATATSSTRNFSAVLEVRTRLRPHRGLPAVRDLDDRLITGTA